MSDTGGIIQDIVTSNGLRIPFTEEYFEEMLPTDFTSVNDLQRDYNENGYVLLKSLLNKSDVNSVRESYFSLFDPVIFKAGTTRTEGVFSGTLQYAPLKHGHPGHPAAEFVLTPQFQNFTSNPELCRIASVLLGSPAKLLPRRPLRHFYNNTQIASRAHADFSYLNEGSVKVLTTWVPIGDVPLRSGGIIYLKGSHKLDLEELREEVSKNVIAQVDKRPLANDLKKVSEITGRKWLYADFAAGDVVMHNPFIVHATLDCNTELMRVSTDIRFAGAGEDPDHRWMKPWRGDDGY